MTRARSYHAFNSEADAIADALSETMPNRDSEEIVSDLRRQIKRNFAVRYVIETSVLVT